MGDSLWESLFRLSGVVVMFVGILNRLFLLLSDSHLFYMSIDECVSGDVRFVLVRGCGWVWAKIKHCVLLESFLQADRGFFESVFL